MLRHSAGCNVCIPAIPGRLPLGHECVYLFRYETIAARNSHTYRCSAREKQLQNTGCDVVHERDREWGNVLNKIEKQINAYVRETTDGGEPVRSIHYTRFSIDPAALCVARCKTVYDRYA